MHVLGEGWENRLCRSVEFSCQQSSSLACTATHWDMTAAQYSTLLVFVSRAIYNTVVATSSLASCTASVPHAVTTLIVSCHEPHHHLGLSRTDDQFPSSLVLPRCYRNRIQWRQAETDGNQMHKRCESVSRPGPGFEQIDSGTARSLGLFLVPCSKNVSLRLVRAESVRILDCCTTKATFSSARCRSTVQYSTRCLSWWRDPRSEYQKSIRGAPKRSDRGAA